MPRLEIEPIASNQVSPRIESEISQGVWSALEERRLRTGEPLDHMIDALLAEALELERHSLFQVSTSNALVQGVFGGVITVADLSLHGDFGIGTFAGLDGELVMIDGKCFRASAGGGVAVADDRREVPFAMVTRFVADHSERVDASASLDELTAKLDSLRPSENVFMGIRVDGNFARLSMRAACSALPGENLVEATGHQSEFDADNMVGTMVGFWSPPYSRSIGVPGYHFHFISDDRKTGGHVLDAQTGRCEIAVQTESKLHLALPETTEFLSADLSGDHDRELERAETEHRSTADRTRNSSQGP